MREERIKRLLQHEAIRGDYVLYWMQQSQRVSYNHALNYAVDQANAHRCALVVLFCLDDSFPDANLRHFSFLLEGLIEVEQELHRRNIGFVFEVGLMKSIVVKWVKNAREVIFDRGYSKFQRSIRYQILQEMKATNQGKLVTMIESDLVVPVESASNKQEYGAYTIRKKIQNQVASFQDMEELAKVIIDGKAYHQPIGKIEDRVNKLTCNKEITKSSFFHGGYQEARRMLDKFLLQQVSSYLDANDPSKNGSSKLSMYLHFGQISTLEILDQVMEAQKNDPTLQEVVDAYVEQLLVRRELAYNYQFYNLGYDAFETMTEPWAYLTMQLHANDVRDVVYTLEEIEYSKTHDPYFNAAMDEMRLTGFMQNTMRMYWGKKIIEWTSTHQEAYERIVTLNNAYFLDGRDAVSYASVAWLFGKHDRPWQERSVFGKLRYMNDKGLERKYDIQSYVDWVDALKKKCK